MLYLVYDSSYPVNYRLCGNLISKDGFVHMKRTASFWVFITIIKGTLHITQNGIPYSVSEGESILLLENVYHFGHKPSEGELSYYWVEFTLTDPNYKIYNFGSLNRRYQKDWITILNNDNNSLTEKCIIPVTSTVGQEKISLIFFSQLLGLATREQYKNTPRCFHATNLLLNQVYNETLPDVLNKSGTIPKKISTIIEWISSHYMEHITASSVAEQFMYNPSYLSNIFKQYTGRSLTDFINNYRIEVAKNLLGSNDHYTLKAIALQTGFPDDKYFMRVFHKYTNMTPKEYKDVTRHKPINTK